MRLALGTVQFGMNYGALDRPDDRVDVTEVAAILDDADAAGIGLLDTARAYGESEAVLGTLAACRRFKIVSKIAPLASPASVRQSFDASLAALRTERLYALLLHRAADLLGPDGPQIWSAMRDLRDDGLVERIGVSVYTPEEADRIAQAFDISIVQLPLSVFDQRGVSTGVIGKLDACGIEVHVRSAFLQGFALAQPATLPSFLTPYGGLLARYVAATQDAGMTPLDAAVRYVREQAGVTKVVVGVQSRRQFGEILGAWRNQGPSLEVEAFASNDAQLLDPARWQ